MLDKSFVEIANPGNIDLLFAGSDELEPASGEEVYE